jgi:hypothetical protein
MEEDVDEEVIVDEIRELRTQIDQLYERMGALRMKLSLRRQLELRAELDDEYAMRLVRSADKDRAQAAEIDAHDD